MQGAHRGLVEVIVVIMGQNHDIDRWQISDGGVYIAVMPLFHTGGSVLGILGAVAKYRK